MNFTLREYQETAVERLFSVANDMLTLKGSKTIIFKAPTGSGKTVMMAEFLKRLLIERDDNTTFSIIWTAPRKLHKQSKRALEKYYFDNKALNCINFEDIVDLRLEDREILFLNWESINKKDNIYIRDNERDHNLSRILENTIDDGRIIILVIDESHFAAKTETSLALISMFNPKVTIEVSATPTLMGDEAVPVDRELVVRDEMIKKRVSINPGFKNTIDLGMGDIGRVRSEAAETTDEFVLRMAMVKRQQLRTAFEDIDSPVNPLLLIQLPDKKQGESDRKEEIVEMLKSKHDVTEQNGKLAIYLSEEKTNLENVIRNDSEVEVMIFKQAIALGWDCPRAAVLVLFREWKSPVFSIQTMGRILRMPELRHYEDDLLNTGFVFTNVKDFSIEGDIAGDYFSINHSTRAEFYSPHKLKSVHSKRFREETRLSPEFLVVFSEAAEERKLSSSINIKVSGISATLISDAEIEDTDLARGLTVELDLDESKKGVITHRRRSPVEIQRVFDSFVRENLAPYAPESRSVGRLKEALQRWLVSNFPLEFDLFGTRGQTVILNDMNRQYFIDTINRAKDLYEQKVVKGKRELIENEKWEISSSYNFGNGYRERNFSKSIMRPFFEAKYASEPERDFVVFLDSNLSGVEWWFKNGDHGSGYFGVPYVDEYGIDRVFYVDWIVKFDDGRIGLFDTKSGIYAKDAKHRAEGLAAYIKQENQTNNRLWGGVVVREHGSWRYNDKEVYEYNPNDLSEWKFLP